VTAGAVMQLSAANSLNAVESDSSITASSTFACVSYIAIDTVSLVVAAC